MKIRLLILIAFTVGLVSLGSLLPGAGPATLAAPASMQPAPQGSIPGQRVSPADWSAIYLPIVVAPPPIFFTDDFESGVAKWTPFVNYWRLSPSQWFWDWGQGYGGSNAYTHQHDRGHCCAEDALTMYLGQGSSEWTDYRYSVRFRAQEGRQAGIWFRGTYKDVETKGQWLTGYYFTVLVLPGEENPARLWQLMTEEDYESKYHPPKYWYHFSNPIALRQVEMTTSVNLGEWHTLTVEAQGPRFKCYVDDELVIDYTDTEGAIFLKGTVGLYAFGGGDHEAIINFDDALVEPLGAY